MPDAPTRSDTWRAQSAEPGAVHVMRADDGASATSLQTMAKRYARANRLKVETRVFGDVCLLRWAPMG